MPAQKTEKKQPRGAAKSAAAPKAPGAPGAPLKPSAPAAKAKKAAVKDGKKAAAKAAQGKGKPGKKGAASPQIPGLDLRASAGQLGSLMKKVLDLADAGVALGVNVVSLLRSVAQNRLSDAGASVEEVFAPGTQPAPSAEPVKGTPPDQPAPRRYCVMNRVPAVPGSVVRVAFSINNDLPQAPRKLAVSAGPFVGAVHGFKIEDGTLSVEPAQKVVAPLDFEKFVLKGTIPAQAPEDSYNGWIAVEGDESIKIPAVLVVGARQR